MKQKSTYIIENIKSVKDKVYEVLIIAPLLCDKDLMNIRPYTQFPVEITNDRKYYIDLYYEEIRLGIEIYEPHHQYQFDSDRLRKKEIEDKLNCQIEEVKITDEFVIYDEIDKLKQLILKRINEEKINSNYQDWNFSFHSLSQAQVDYPNAIFANANNFTHGVHGPLKVNADIRKNADLFVVYSGDTVYKVFQITPESWIKSNDYNHNFLQYGTELPSHPLIASGATDWNVTTNRAYGKNIQQFSSYKKSIMQKKTKYSPKGKYKKIIRKTS